MYEHNENICEVEVNERSHFKVKIREIDAFWLLWRQNYGYLRRVALRVCGGDWHEAHDILGDTCIRLAERLPENESVIVDIRRWMTRVVVNVAIDRIRSRKRGTVAVGTLDDLAVLTDDRSDFSQNTPEEEACLREQVDRTLVALAALPERLSSVARLHFLQDVPYAEIATMLGISQALARKRIQEARAHLQPFRAATGSPRRKPLLR